MLCQANMNFSYKHVDIQNNTIFGWVFWSTKRKLVKCKGTLTQHFLLLTSFAMENRKRKLMRISLHSTFSSLVNSARRIRITQRHVATRRLISPAWPLSWIKRMLILNLQHCMKLSRLDYIVDVALYCHWWFHEEPSMQTFHSTKGSI